MSLPALIILGFALLRLWQRLALQSGQRHRARLNAYLAACPALPTPPPPRRCANARLHLVAAVLVTVLGLTLQFNVAEWARAVFAVALVFITELLNSALEHLCDVISLAENPTIGKAKDIAAAAVLIAALTACAVLATILLPRLLPAASTLCGG